MSGLIFAESGWLWAVPAVAAAGVLLWLAARRAERRRVAAFLSARRAGEALAAAGTAGKALRFGAVLAVLMLLGVALARPLTGPRPDRAERKGTDFVVVLDVSKSMWTEDVLPNRLAAVKTEMEDWVLHLSGDRMGLVLFAGTAFVQAPITFDYEALDLVLRQAGPKSISLGGTNIQKAIETALPLFDESDVDSRVLILVSDGEGLDGDAVAAARAAGQAGRVTIFTVGVGTPEGGDVPADDYSASASLPPDQRPKRSYIPNDYGANAHSRLDEQNLRAIASATGGRYYSFAPGTGTFATLHAQGLAPLARKSQALDVHDYYEWFQVPLRLAIGILALIPFLPAGRRPPPGGGTGVATVRPADYSPAGSRGKGLRGKAAVRAALVAAGLLLGGTGLAFPAFAAPMDEAEKMLAAGKDDAAVDAMAAAVRKSADDFYLYYNYGLTLYRAGRYEEALLVFQRVQQASTDPGLQARALLQMGNAQYRLGEGLQKKSLAPEAALAMERALGDFQSLDKLDSSSASRNNLQAASLSLKELLGTIAQSRVKLADGFAARQQLLEEERFVRQAIQAYRRIQELDPSDGGAAQGAAALEKRLADNLAAQGAALAAAADAAAAKDTAKAKEVLDKRQQAMGKFDDALKSDPANAAALADRQEQAARIAASLADEAEKQAAPLLPKPSLSGPEQRQLDAVAGKLAQARALDPENQKAIDLSGQVARKLEDSYMAEGEKALAGAAAKADAQARFDAVNHAAESFQKALQYDPQNGQAQADLQKAREQLPGAYAGVGASEMQKAQGQLGQNQSQGQGADAVKGALPVPALQQAVGSLEKATQNFGMAAALRPDSADFKAGLQQAQSQLAGAREQLEKAMLAGKADGQGGKPPGSPDGEPGSEGDYRGGETMADLSGLRARGVPAKTGDNFWKGKVRDW